jgi:hypothetical protein
MEINVNDLIEIINDAGYDVREYSGRGMYGKQCLAYFVGNGNLLASVALIIGYVNDDEFRHSLVHLFENDVRTDDMGLGTIVYFPNMEFHVESKMDKYERF